MSRTPAKAGKPMPVKAPVYFSRAVAKAFEALEAVRESTFPVSLNVLSARIRLTKPSTLRILHTLESLGYLRRDDRGYFPPGRALAPPIVHELLLHGGELLRSLRAETRETASLAALFENHIEVLLVEESLQLIRMANTVGRIIPPHASALGKVITAFQAEDVSEHLIRSYGTPSLTADTIDDAHLPAELETIRKRGYAEDREESTLGAVCFGAPVLRPEGFAVAAVSVSLPKMRLDGKQHQQQIVEAVRRTAAKIASRVFPHSRARRTLSHSEGAHPV